MVNPNAYDLMVELLESNTLSDAATYLQALADCDYDPTPYNIGYLIEILEDITRELSLVLQSIS